MDMRIYFPGGKKVYADYKGFTIETDQSTKHGGDGSAPEPFDLFMASLGTCAGIYVLGFCQKRDIDTQGIEIVQTSERDPETRMIKTVKIEIGLPENFPPQYRKAIVQTAKLCTVKKHLEKPPEFEVTLRTPEDG